MKFRKDIVQEFCASRKFCTGDTKRLEMSPCDVIVDIQKASGSDAEKELFLSEFADFVKNIENATLGY